MVDLKLLKSRGWLTFCNNCVNGVIFYNKTDYTILINTKPTPQQKTKETIIIYDIINNIQTMKVDSSYYEITSSEKLYNLFHLKSHIYDTDTINYIIGCLKQFKKG